MLKLTLTLLTLASGAWGIAFTEVAAAANPYPPATPQWAAYAVAHGESWKRDAHGVWHVKPACGAEDSASWVWSRCGNKTRGVVTMWGTPKVVTCGDLRWLVRHGDLDPHTPRLKGDASCGRSR